MSKNGKPGKRYSGINSMDAPTNDGRGFFGEEGGSDNIVDGQEQDEMAELDFGHGDL